jgi:hypothetical protein
LIILGNRGFSEGIERETRQGRPGCSSAFHRNIFFGFFSADCGQSGAQSCPSKPIF